MRKVLKPLIIITLLLGVAYLVFTIYLTPNERFNAINVIPDKSTLIIEVDNPLNTWKKVNKSKVWQNFTINKLFEDVNKQITSVDSLLTNNKILFKVFGSRYVLFSLHQRPNNTFEPLIVADLERYSKLSSVKKYILSLTNENVTITKRGYKDFNIYEIFYKKKHSTLYLSFHKNLAILSYDQHLLEESLDCILEPVLGRNDQFVQIHNHIFGDGLMRLYLNYNQLNKIIKSSDAEFSAEILDFINSVYFSGFKLDALENIFSIEGYTNFGKNQVSYLNALSKSGSGTFLAQKIIPKSARFAVRFGFDSFDQFMIQFEELCKNQGVYDEYLSNYNKLEKKLDIDVQENFIDWIDDEITLFSIEPRNKSMDDEYFLAIKAKNRRSAIKNLGFIKAQIDRKTPIEFTTIEYNGYEINYLQIKGLIKLLFGKAFLKMDKPYYTIIEDFVVFSNHPQSIKDLINDYKKDETLKQWNSFQTFYKKNFISKSNVFVYANVPFITDAYAKNSDFKMKSKLKKNEDFFNKNPFVALDMVSEDDLYKTKFVLFSDDSLYLNELIDIRERNLLKEKKEISDYNTEDLKLNKIVVKESADYFLVEDLAIIDLTAKRHFEYFSDSVIRIDVEVENGIKDGRFTEYYENGELKLKGKFNNDIQVGTWKYYDIEGKLIEKKKF